MVRAPAAAPAPEEEELTAPTFLEVFRTGAPGFLREGFLPLGAFYAGLRLDGLTAGIVASAAASLLVYLYERHAGREGLLVRLSLFFVVVQSVVGLAAHSTTVYLAQPVLLAAAWGLAFLVSVPLGRPLAGSIASAWYPFPRWFRETPEFKRVFGIESLVWAGYFLARSGLRLAILLRGSLESFFAVTVVTGTPVMLLLLAWSIRYSIRRLSD
jgi:hypothetical protein